MNAVPASEDESPAAAIVAKDGAMPLPATIGARPRFGALLSMLTAFWGYVTLSNILYANSLQTTLSMLGSTQLFAAWPARLLQHALLFPVLVACIWLAMRIGWRPVWRRAPLQLACGVAFAVLGTPALVLGEWLAGEHVWMHEPGQAGSPLSDLLAGPTLPLWLAGATSFLLTYLFGLALVTGFDLYRRYRDAQVRSAALERSLSAAHLAALRMQLSPHTLFNLLHTIRGEIAWDPAAAQAMIVQLGDLLRRVLRAGDSEFSRLQDELEFARLYLGLQQKRFVDRLTLRLPDVRSAAVAWVPSLILQPLVENAAVHGLAGGTFAVVIAVEVEARDEILVLRVVNTDARSRPAGDAGIGLRNVRERLAIHFGERAWLTAEPRDDGAWVAEIGLPLLREVH